MEVFKILVKTCQWSTYLYLILPKLLKFFACLFEAFLAALKTFLGLIRPNQYCQDPMKSGLGAISFWPEKPNYSRSLIIMNHYRGS